MHNQKRLQVLLEQATAAQKPPLYSIGIAHDDWCQMYLGGPCNCDPDITITEVTAANRDEIVAKIARDTARFRKKREEKIS